ncbi:thiamine phosphate synthase [Rhodobaculum claviforme]|uniref:Thiamine-phosphate synthase n=1 Tax=Rhodobaculum claviforme TaxID=1549854 RepID=A0A934WK40_9RHOB|nr:thiamine phosphate synthase [Rhodobaculum claviforme]MBK5928711.1 thiamine-phosphate diphosphorylase [Rhodobaculum claviforme]
MTGRAVPGPIYVVTDPGAALSVTDQALAAARGGAGAVQLRHKTATDAEFAALARALLAVLPADVRLILNDRVAVATALGPRVGLHIGQGDGDPAVVRARIGPDMVLGLSVEDPAQLRALPPGVVDHIGAGPVRATASKPDHAPPIGFGGLARIVAAAPCPVVAIGGLGPGDAARVRAAGCVGMAVVSAVTRAPDPEAATRALCDDWTQEEAQP